MDLRLNGKVAVVTGASAGIGREIALQLAAEGSTVVAVARRRDKLDELAAEATANTIAPWVADLAVSTDRERLVEHVEATHGRVDVLVNNAGYSRQVPLAEDDRVWRDAFELNFHAVRLLTERLVPGMVERRSGAVVNVTARMEPLALNASGAAKIAVNAWAKALSREVAPHGVRVNNVLPGKIHSEQLDNRVMPDVDEQRRFASTHIPVGRFGGPEDLAPLVLFLVSDRAAYITGQSIAVDGGMQHSL